MIHSWKLGCHSVSHELGKTVLFVLFFFNAEIVLSCVPSGLLETGPREGVVVAGVDVVEEDGAWAEETASTPVGNETLTDTAAVTNRESVLDLDVRRPSNTEIEMTTYKRHPVILIFVCYHNSLSPGQGCQDQVALLTAILVFFLSI